MRYLFIPLGVRGVSGAEGTGQGELAMNLLQEYGSVVSAVG